MRLIKKTLTLITMPVLLAGIAVTIGGYMLANTTFIYLKQQKRKLEEYAYDKCGIFDR